MRNMGKDFVAFCSFKKLQSMYHLKYIAQGICRGVEPLVAAACPFSVTCRCATYLLPCQEAAYFL